MVITARQGNRRLPGEEILAGLPVIEVPCTVPDEDRNCPYCNTPMEVIGKKGCPLRNCGLPLQKVERIQYVQEVLGCPECKKDGASVIVGAETPSPLLKHSLASPSTVALRDVPEICEQHPVIPPGSGLETAGCKTPQRRHWPTGSSNAAWIIWSRCMNGFTSICWRGTLSMQMKHPCQVLKEDGENGAVQVLICGCMDPEMTGCRRSAWYDYQPSRGGYHAEEFLKGVFRIPYLRWLQRLQ